MIDSLVGVGLRSVHYPYLVERPRTGVGWFEAISENYMDTAGRPLKILEGVRRDYPIALHGVSLSIGQRPDPTSAAEIETFTTLRMRYLDRLASLIDRIDPFIVSDHLCWTGVPGGNIHDLLPVPFTPESLTWICEQVDLVQTRLGRTIALENVSSYLTWNQSTLGEAEFLVEVTRRTGCKVLLDVNNIFVTSRNHGLDALSYLDSIPADCVAQIHLAGHTDMGTHLFDTHNDYVCDEVWELFDRVIARLPKVPVLIEWDDDIPEFPILAAEAEKAARIRERHHPDLAAASL
ncbi:MAG: hypothetical protein ACI8TX_002745 [Hyphomicrobiaceae bacterium]|jgi:uncharacterized protein (UPF0276 family)